MLSILSEIKKLRGSDAPLSVDLSNTNRYRVVINETDRTKTAYYFSTPIYNNITKKTISMKFYESDDGINYIGSNAKIKISDNMRFENEGGSFSIALNEKAMMTNEQEILVGNNKIYPTLNGIAYLVDCSVEKGFSFVISTDSPYTDIRSNDKYFSLMKNKFEPFFTVSCIGTTNSKGEISAPAKIHYQKISHTQYILSVRPCTPLYNSVLLEINMYENKLFQDTTVESNNPCANNVFGSVAFIGNTNEYGEQWLYSRLDFSILSDLLNKKIQNATIHIPVLNKSNVILKAHKVSSRFCSFGSNWDNKIPIAEPITSSDISKDYQNIDITSLLTDEHGMLKLSDGLILRTKIKNTGFTAISTGDSYYAPQILEVRCYSENN